MATTLTLTAFAALTAVTFLLGWTIVRLQRDPIRERLVSAIDDENDGRKTPSAFADQLPKVTFNQTEIDKDLRRAGFYKASAKAEFFAVRNVLAILILLAAVAIAVAIGPEHREVVAQIVLGGVFCALLGWAIPRVVLGVQGSRRVTRICRTLPDALDMMSMCMLGGMTLEDALAHVSREIFMVHPDLAIELLIIRQQAEMNSMEFAFEQFADRVDGLEVQNLQSLITQDRRLGAGVGHSIREYADSLRLKRRMSADQRAAAVQFWLIFPFVFCLVPAIALFLFTPSIVELVNYFVNGGADAVGASIPNL